MRMIVALCGAFLCAGTVQAQVYKCVDAGGKTIYSQAPCPKSAKSTTIQNAAPAPAPAPAAKAGDAKSTGPKTAAELEQDFRKRKLAQEEARKKQEQAVADSKAKQEICKNARSTLAMLEQSSRQVRFNEKGERYFLNDSQIESEKDRARKAVQSSCN